MSNFSPSTEKRIISKYKILYSCGVIQFKNLISHDDYLNILKPTEAEIYELERKNKWKPTPQSKQLERNLITMFSDNYFTTESPLAYAITTNVLSLPKAQGGNTKCILTEII